MPSSINSHVSSRTGRTASSYSLNVHATGIVEKLSGKRLMPTEAEFRVTWEEFHAILRLGGDAGSHWAKHALQNAKRLEEILGKQRGAELITLIESHSQVLLAPTPGSRVSQSRQAKSTYAPTPPSSPGETPATLDQPVPLPPPLSPPPPKVEVPMSPFSPPRAKPARAFTHSHPTWDVDPTLLPKKPPGRT